MGLVNSKSKKPDIIGLSCDELLIEIGNNAVLHIEFELVSVQSAADITAVINALCENTSVQRLDFTGVNLNAEHIQRIAVLLRQNTTLKELNLSQQGIGIEGINQLVDALIGNTSLEELYLSSNPLADEGIAILGRTLVQNKSITCVNIHDCQATPIGINAFYNALVGKNQPLRKLFISENPMDANALRALTALISNTTLTELTLNGICPTCYPNNPQAMNFEPHYQCPLNFNKGEWIDAFCLLIREAKTVKILSISNNSIPQPYYDQVISALKDNTSIVTIETSCNSPGRIAFQQKWLERNQKIAENPGRRTEICKAYEVELDALSHDQPKQHNRASHWKNHSRGNESNGKANGSSPPETSSLDML